MPVGSEDNLVTPAFDVLTLKVHCVRRSLLSAVTGVARLIIAALTLRSQSATVHSICGHSPATMTIVVIHALQLLAVWWWQWTDRRTGRSLLAVICDAQCPIRCIEVPPAQPLWRLEDQPPPTFDTLRLPMHWSPNFWDPYAYNIRFLKVVATETPTHTEKNTINTKNNG